MSGALHTPSQRALKLPAVARLLGRVRRVTGFFHQSAIGLHTLQEKQKLLELSAHRLITDVSTRWNSAHDMVERFLEQQPAITAALISAEVRKGDKDICTFPESDISNAEEFVQALKAMKVATCVLLDESNPTLSVVAPLLAQLLQDTQEMIGDPPFIKEIKEAVHQGMRLRRRRPHLTKLQRLIQDLKHCRSCPMMRKKKHLQKWSLRLQP